MVDDGDCKAPLAGLGGQGSPRRLRPKDHGPGVQLLFVLHPILCEYGEEPILCEEHRRKSQKGL